MNQLPKSTQAEALFLDANVLLEIILSRENEATARKALEMGQSNLFISSLTAHLIVHFGKALVALPVLRQFLSDYTILGLESVDFEWAFTNLRNDDFEDALQIGVAIRNGCADFLTFDKGLYKAYADLPSICMKLLE
jgi:predicted nucleic acid-binding protein